MASRIVNLAPAPDSTGMLLEDYFRFSLRDTASRIDISTVLVELLYSGAHYEGAVLPEDDEQLAKAGGNSFVAAFSDSGSTAVPASQAVGRAAVGSLSLTRTLGGAHRGAQFITSTLSEAPLAVEMDVLPGAWTLGAAAYLNDARYAGICLGSVYGPAKTGVFVFLIEDLGVPKVLVSGPDNGTGARPGAVEVALDWTVAQTFKFVWDVAYRNVVEVYARPAADPEAEVALLASFVFSALPPFIDAVALGPHPMGSDAEALEEVMGFVNLDSTTLADTVQVDSLRVFEFGLNSVVNGILWASSEVRLRPSDLVVADVTRSPAEALLPWTEDLVAGSVSSDGAAVTVRKVSGTDDGELTASIVREEPSLDLTKGVILYTKFKGLNDSHVGSASTGMGFAFDDGSDRLVLALLDDFVSRTVGVYQAGSSYQLASYERPAVAVDWHEEVGLKLVADAGSGNVEVYLLGDDDEPVITASLATLAASSGDTEILFGHIDTFIGRPVFGDLQVSRLEYGLNARLYDARNGLLPPAASPGWAETSAGPGSIVLDGDDLLITDGGYLDNGGGAQFEFLTLPGMGPTIGVTVEARFRVESWLDDHGVPGLYTVIMSSIGIDDGVDLLIPYFISSTLGRHVVLPTSTSDLTDILALVDEGLAYPLDFEDFHTYRLEKRPYQHIRLYIDDADTPAIDIPWDNGFDIRLPSVHGSGVVFGSMDTDTGGVSRWKRVWLSVGDGYDLAVRPVLSENDRPRVFDTTAELVVKAEGI